MRAFQGGIALNGLRYVELEVGVQPPALSVLEETYTLILHTAPLLYIELNPAVGSGAWSESSEQSVNECIRTHEQKTVPCTRLRVG